MSESDFREAVDAGDWCYLAPAVLILAALKLLYFLYRKLDGKIDENCSIY